MSFSKKNLYYFLITLLFILVPFSLHWRLFLFGNKATGKVIMYRTTLSVTQDETDPNIIHSVISFSTDRGEYVEFVGPQHMVYPLGKEFLIFYNDKKPSKFVMFSFAGLILNPKMILPGVLLIIWLSFYFSLLTGKK